jgi:hypothetical protein
MNIPADFLRLLISEMERIETECEQATDPEERLYYFSAIFGTINRIMNFHCDPALVFIHQVLQQTHQELQARLKASRSPGVEQFVLVPKQMMDSLLSYVSELKVGISSQDDQAISRALQKFASLGYATTGNGYYLYTIGRLRVE